jgi:hypothetical protein
MNPAQPTDDDAGDQRAAGCRQRNRNTFNRHDDRADQAAD